MELLDRVVGLLRESGLRVGNVDVTVIAERPAIAPVAGKMVERLSEVLGIAPDAVSVKGKSNEGMGWIGTGEGMAVHAVALLEGSGDDGGP